MPMYRRRWFALAAAVLVSLSALALANRHTTAATAVGTREVFHFTHPLSPSTPHAVPLGSPGSGWTLEGCWAQFQSSTCFDIYRDGSGNFWKCSQCGTTKKANPNTCAPISQQTLNSGFWCS